MKPLIMVNIDSTADWITFQLHTALFELMPNLLPKKVLKNFKEKHFDKAMVVCNCELSEAKIKPAQTIADGMIIWAMYTKAYPLLGKTQKEANSALAFYYGLGKCATGTEVKKYLTQLGINCI